MLNVAFCGNWNPWSRSDCGLEMEGEILRIDVLGVGFDDLTMAGFVAKARKHLEDKRPGYVVTPNAEIVYEAARDAGYRDILNQAALVLPDGAGVVLGAKILGKTLGRKVPGIEFGLELCDLLASTGGRLYLLGGKPGIAEQAAEKLARQFPALTICGAADGYFTDEQAVLEKLRQSRADVVFVCLGAPKQEVFMHRHLEETGATLLLGLGGSLDGYAGTVRRAPQFMIRANLEWLYRLWKEPRRLGRMMRLPKFLWLCVLERWKRRNHG